MTATAEADVDNVALAWLKSLGWNIVRGTTGAERSDYGQMMLDQRLRPRPSPAGSPSLPVGTQDDALRKHPCFHWNKGSE